MSSERIEQILAFFMFSSVIIFQFIVFVLIKYIIGIYALPGFMGMGFLILCEIYSNCVGIKKTKELEDKLCAFDSTYQRTTPRAWGKKIT